MESSATTSVLAGESVNATHFAFQLAPEPWQLAFVLFIAVLIGYAGWRWYGPGPAGKLGILARFARALALAFAVVLLAGPQIVSIMTVKTPGTLLVAVDSSLSMDQDDGPQGRPRISVAEDLATTLAANRPGLTPLYVRIGGQSGSFVPGSNVPATGALSALGDELARLVSARQPDHLIVVTDARVTEGQTLAQAAGTWAQRGQDLRLSVLLTGSHRIPADLWIEDVHVNREAALDEREPVRVRIGVRGATTPVQVRLDIDGVAAGQTSIEIDNSSNDPVVPLQMTADLAAVFPAAGSRILGVTVEGAGQQRRAEIRIDVAARPLKVLMLAQRPTYELRYLREALRRDRTTSVHAYLADGRWRRWGAGSNETAGPEIMPRDMGEFAAYDVIILGDIASQSLQPTQIQGLAEAVRKQACGLLLIPGETGGLTSFSNTPVGELIPVALGDPTSQANAYLRDTTLSLHRTPLAAAQGLLEPGTLTWDQLPSLRGSMAITTDAVSAGAEILAEDQSGNPLVVSRSYGSGRSVVVGVDDTWRWRRHVGDLYLHRFHSQLLRFAGAGRRTAQAPWRLSAMPRRVSQGEPVTIQLLPQGVPGGIDLSALRPGVRLTGNGQERVLALVRDGVGFTARLSAPQAGIWTISSNGDPAAAPVELHVSPPAGETRDPRHDPAGAAAFASAAGGRVYVNVDDLVAELPTDLSTREEIVSGRGLWDTATALIIVVMLLAVDWSIRRMTRFP